jgi:hypothetical protein
LRRERRQTGLQAANTPPEKIPAFYGTAGRVTEPSSATTASGGTHGAASPLKKPSSLGPAMPTRSAGRVTEQGAGKAARQLVKRTSTLRAAASPTANGTLVKTYFSPKAK